MNPSETNVVCFPETDGYGGTSASPAAMARHLRKAHPSQARRFALAMHEAAAWANEAWGQFWADVVRLV